MLDLPPRCRARCGWPDFQVRRVPDTSLLRLWRGDRLTFEKSRGTTFPWQKSLEQSTRSTPDAPRGFERERWPALALTGNVRRGPRARFDDSSKQDQWGLWAWPQRCPSSTDSAPEREPPDRAVPAALCRRRALHQPRVADHGGAAASRLQDAGSRNAQIVVAEKGLRPRAARNCGSPSSATSRAWPTTARWSRRRTGSPIADDNLVEAVLSVQFEPGGTGPRSKGDVRAVLDGESSLRKPA